MNLTTVLLVRVSSEVDKDVDHPQFYDPPYPLKYIQAGLSNNQDLKVVLVDCWVRPMSVPQMLEYTVAVDPDLIVVSASSFDVMVANDFVTSIKRKESHPIIIGIGQGHYLNRDFHNTVDAAYDTILLGEPEEEFFRLFERLRSTSDADPSWRTHYQTCYQEGKRFIVENPDSLPFPSYTPEELDQYRSIFPVRVPKRVVWGYLIATRGCPHACTFCSEVMRVSIGRKLRLRQAANVADEMEHLGRQGVNVCSFQDDTFSAPHHFVRSLCKELIARNSQMPWMARVRVDEINYDLLTLMKRAGCVMLGIGVESGSQRIVDEMDKLPKSRSWRDLCRQAFAWARKLDIGTNAYYVIGNPGETREEIEQTIQFAMELNSDTIQVHFYTPYPGSRAWDTYHDKLGNTDPAKMFHYANPTTTLAQVSVDELIRLRSLFYRRYIFRPGFALRHMKRYASFYWHNPDIFWSLAGIRKVF